uniref:Uncharacterized protein n=1 Tax=Rhizophora mucronata TaxID=61149 RepID=A0A2P2PWY1_RHIMU
MGAFIFLLEFFFFFCYSWR